MMQMMGPTMQSMLVYAPSVGFETLHDFPISLTRTELESVLPGATQISGRSLYLSFSQVCEFFVLHQTYIGAATSPIHIWI
jgi:hypothetical protein